MFNRRIDSYYLTCAIMRILLTDYIVINNHSVDTIVIDVLLRKIHSLLYNIR